MLFGEYTLLHVSASVVPCSQIGPQRTLVRGIMQLLSDSIEKLIVPLENGPVAALELELLLAEQPSFLLQSSNKTAGVSLSI